MHTIHIHGTSVRSLTDLYEEVLKQLPHKREYFGYNLDALYDILSEGDVDRIVIHKSRYLKQALEEHHTDDTNLSEYYQVIDILTDLDHVDIILQDD